MDTFFHYPTTLVGLFIFVVVGMMTLFGLTVRSLLRQHATFTERISATQDRIADTLDNHLAHISEQLTSTSRILEQINTKLLDAVLVKHTTTAKRDK